MGRRLAGLDGMGLRVGLGLLLAALGFLLVGVAPLLTAFEFGNEARGFAPRVFVQLVERVERGVEVRAPGHFHAVDERLDGIGGRPPRRIAPALVMRAEIVARAVEPDAEGGRPVELVERADGRADARDERIARGQFGRGLLGEGAEREQE